MQLISLGFLIFIFIGVLLYYLISKKFQPFLLLFMSAIFYCSYRLSAVIYILVTILTTYIAAIKLEEMDKKSKKRKIVLLITLMINFGMLAFIKYTSFAVDNFNGLFKQFHWNILLPGISILAPIGISFYTFQVVGYLLDVYWGRDKAERTLWKHALFVSFFPQIIQGPISKHNDLQEKLFAGHHFQYLNIKYGILLMIWGFFKKMIIADTLAVAVHNVYDVQNSYGVSVIVGILCYCMQLYCDFSGGIDVIRGVARLFDIELVDNFKRPFFSKSIAEFWRRWHITLGVWMKDYVFYPVSLSKWMTKFGSKCRKRFGNKLGRKLPVCVANLIVFFIVGLWHGANWNFIVYGLYNGFIIAISSLITPLYDKLFAITKINKKSTWYQLVQILRTFVLVNIGWYFDRSISLRQTFSLMGRTFISKVPEFINGTYLGLHKYQYLYVIFAIVMVLIVEVMQERGIIISKWMESRPILIQYAIWFILLFSIPIMGYYSLDANMVGGFMYANF